MRACLAAGSENTQNASIFAGEKFGRDGGCCCGAHIGEIVRGRCQPRARGIGIEEQVRGLDAVFGTRWFVLHDDQFHSHGVGGAIMAQHDQEYALGCGQVSAIRNDRGGVAIAEGGFDCGDDLGGGEAFSDFVFGESDHGWRVQG